MPGIGDSVKYPIWWEYCYLNDISSFRTIFVYTHTSLQVNVYFPVDFQTSLGFFIALSFFLCHPHSQVSKSLSPLFSLFSPSQCLCSIIPFSRALFFIMILFTFLVSAVTSCYNLISKGLLLGCTYKR